MAQIQKMVEERILGHIVTLDNFIEFKANRSPQSFSISDDETTITFSYDKKSIELLRDLMLHILKDWEEL